MSQPPFRPPVRSRPRLTRLLATVLLLGAAASGGAEASGGVVSAAAAVGAGGGGDAGLRDGASARAGAAPAPNGAGRRAGADGVNEGVNDGVGSRGGLGSVPAAARTGDASVSAAPVGVASVSAPVGGGSAFAPVGGGSALAGNASASALARNAPASAVQAGGASASPVPGPVPTLTGNASAATSPEPTPAPTGTATPTPTGNAAPGPTFWVDPNSAAARQVVAWRSQGRAGDAQLIQRIAGRPQAVWLHSSGPEAVVRAATEAAAAEGRTPVLVAYFIPHRDCGDYSDGGAGDAAEYRQWVDEFAAGIGDRAAYVIVEPDAVAHEISGCAKADAAERYGLLAYAVDRLKARPHTRVYLDAGNSSWIPDEQRLLAPLRQAGIAKADGFALNVSNYRTNEESLAYGRRIAAALGGDKHFVVDSSRNGNGPYTGGDDEPWCNPPGRALGTPPTSATGDPALDAYLWIKRPGESDGTCRGGPRAGQWWPEYALGLASRARG